MRKRQSSLTPFVIFAGHNARSTPPRCAPVPAAAPIVPGRRQSAASTLPIHPPAQLAGRNGRASQTPNPHTRCSQVTSCPSAGYIAAMSNRSNAVVLAAGVERRRRPTRNPARSGADIPVKSARDSEDVVNNGFGISLGARVRCVGACGTPQHREVVRADRSLYFAVPADETRPSAGCGQNRRGVRASRSWPFSRLS